jgi:2-polyprenyl-3-methyl-5-hydroxy-6-metoxy-1,4-benzoquinol methylase
MTADNNDYMGGLLSGFLETQRLRQASQHIKGGDKVLDLACNEGHLIDFLPANVNYVGIDINETAIEQAQQLHPSHEFMVADLSDSLPADLHQLFNVIVMLALLEHIPQPQNLLRVAAQALQPTGRIVVTTPSPWGRQVHDIGARLGMFSKEAAKEHETFLGKRTLYQIAHDAGLEVDTFRYFLLGFNQLIIMKPGDRV